MATSNNSLRHESEMALQVFKHTLQSQIEKARQGELDRDQIRQQMLILQPRLVEFKQLATRFLSEIIHPRVVALKELFANAVMDRDAQSNGCGVWFEYCDRFPASVRLEFTIEHDDLIEHIILRYELRIQPVFLKYEPHDKLALSMKDNEENRLAAWIEQKLLDFLNDYLRLDCGNESLENDFATDPVCGMRVTNGTAMKESYRGHSYSFCSDDCRERFVKEPSRYVWFKIT